MIRAVIDISDIDVSIKMSCDIDIDIENVDIDILELGRRFARSGGCP